MKIMKSILVAFGLLAGCLALFAGAQAGPEPLSLEFVQTALLPSLAIFGMTTLAANSNRTF